MVPGPAALSDRHQDIDNQTVGGHSSLVDCSQYSFVLQLQHLSLTAIVLLSI